MVIPRALFLGASTWFNAGFHRSDGPKRTPSKPYLHLTPKMAKTDPF